MGIGVFTYLSIASMVIAGIISLATYYQPKNIRATVADAALSNLTLIQQQNVVSYKLTVHMTLYNPSVRVNIYYDSLDAILRLAGMEAVLGGPANSTWLAETYQLQKTSDDLEVSFDYGRGAVIAGDMAAQLHRDINDDDGAVSFEMVMHAQMRYRSGAIKTHKKARITCPLKIPVVVNKRRHGGGVVVDGVLSPGGRCKVKY
ncbi:unnamed protein product [Urochloa decumbens]|uniref:Late embryogenesis abundant protein LEA-2 subgroup domain-containing protein n=1 Tax=Urochloa decumbens TaxID=240449 RepID=A0ABC9H6F4_9POAL